MGQALYRSHRPKSLEEVVGQEHITRTLEQALKQGRISHAYLFTGPRGVGKTSVARILAHAVNGLPYEDDSPHIDIIEIDAASNRRIDEIRDLRDKIYVAPVSAKYKVYIIDEVHMLTREAFNALLKTLEEPPAHVVFILATTDSHKLPETIISRTQRFGFRPVESNLIASQLKKIAQHENLNITDEAINLLAEHGQGSLRDSISLLDQAGNHNAPVDANAITELLGVPPASAVDQLLNDLSQGSVGGLMRGLSALFDQGYQAPAVAKQIGLTLRQQLSQGQATLPADVILELLGLLIDVPASTDPERALEVAILKAAPEPSSGPVQADPETKPVTEEPKPVRKNQAQPFDNNIWAEVLKVLKQQHNTLYGVIRMGQPSFEGDQLTIAFAFGFHQKRLNENSNRQKLVDIIYGLTGQAVTINCIVDKAATPPKIDVEAAELQPAKPAANHDSLSTISNIFGNAELLES